MSRPPTQEMGVAAPENAKHADHWRSASGGALACIVVGVCSIYLSRKYHLNSNEVALIVVAISGLLVGVPYVTAAWMTMALLALTTLALGAGRGSLAATFANVAFFALAVTAVWSIWNMILQSLRWEPPLRTLWRYVSNVWWGNYLPVLLSASAIIILGVWLSMETILTPLGNVFVIVLIAGMVLRVPWSFAVWSVVPLVLFTIVAFVIGSQSLFYSLVSMLCFDVISVFLLVFWNVMALHLRWPLSLASFTAIHSRLRN